MNYSALPGATIFNGTYNIAQQLVILISGTFLGGGTDYIRAFAVGTGFALVGVAVAFVGFRFTREEVEAA